MNYLVDLLHPTEFHFSYGIIIKLIENGHKVIITARNEEILIELLKNTNFEYTLLSKKSKNFLGLAYELIFRSSKLAKISRKEKIDCYFGMSAISTILANLFRKKPIIYFTENEEMGLKTRIVLKNVSKLFTPIYYNKNLGKKHEKFNSLIQLSYLHPKYFTPDKKIINKYLKLDVDRDKYFLLRFCDWKASHDLKEKGFSKKTKFKLVDFLQKFGKVFILDESNDHDFLQYKPNFPRHLIFHILAFSSLTIAETTSVAIESGLLCVPVVRCSTLVNTRKGGAAIFEEMEKNNLIYNFSDENEAYQKVEKIVKENKNKAYWINNRDKFIEQFDSDIINKLYQKIIENS